MIHENAMELLLPVTPGTESELCKMTALILCYSDFVDKLIRAGRNDGTNFFFSFVEELDRGDFIKFANRFIENYYATVPPDFAIQHRMKFRFVIIAEDGGLALAGPGVTARTVEQYPLINGGLLYIEGTKDGEDGIRSLDASVHRQACFIQRENRKFWNGIAGVAVAAAALIFGMALRK